MGAVALFGLVAAIGIGALVIDLAAMANDPTPSQYHTGLTGLGFTLLIVGVVGAGCAFFWA